MDKMIKARWVAALRDGSYTQGKGQLAIEVATDRIDYCCLGVLCDLAVKDGVVTVTGTGTTGTTDYLSVTFVNFDYEGGVLPHAVREWAGIDHGDPTVIYEDESTSLAVLNDDGESFAVIADVIEEQL